MSGRVTLIPQQQWRAAWLVFAVTAALVTLWVARAATGRAGVAGNRRQPGHFRCSVSVRDLW
jgi:hypothetical protein